jgi:hypothetical protein
VINQQAARVPKTSYFKLFAAAVSPMFQKPSELNLHRGELVDTFVDRDYFG